MVKPAIIESSFTLSTGPERTKNELTAWDLKEIKEAERDRKRKEKHRMFDDEMRKKGWLEYYHPCRRMRTHDFNFRAVIPEQKFMTNA